MSRKQYRPTRNPPRAHRVTNSGGRTHPINLAVVAIAFVSLVFGALLLQHGAAAAGSTAGAMVNANPPSKLTKGGPVVTHSPQQYKKVSCGVANKPACPAVDPGWITVPAASAPDLASAAFVSTLAPTIGNTIAHSGMFAGIEGRYGKFEVDSPALVHPYGPVGAGASDYFVDDHWVVTVRNSTGVEIGILDYVYDSANNRIRFSSYAVLTPQDAQYGHAFPLFSANSLETQVHAARDVSLETGATPALIFFPAAWAWNTIGVPKNWTGGGSTPMDPIWLMPGANGQNYFLGIDGKVYTQQELPVAAG
jgi:hypothetical protein